MNTDKLSPAPWEVHDAGHDHTICVANYDGGGCKPLFERWDGNTDTTDAEFIVLARNAFDVMMRRGWHTVARRAGEGFNVRDLSGCLIHPEWDSFHDWPDPFTALVAADEWYKANVENQ